MKVNGVGIIHPISDYPIYEMENNGNFKKEMFETANKLLAVIPMPFYMGNLSTYAKTSSYGGFLWGVLPSNHPNETMLVSPW